MLELAESDLIRDGETFTLAHDHGLEQSPSAFEVVEKRSDPESVFETAARDAVTGPAVGRAWQYEDRSASPRGTRAGRVRGCRGRRGGRCIVS
jgi:hypothetical protein